MHGASLAGEASAEAGKDRRHGREGFPKAAGGVAAVFAGVPVVRERNRVRDFARTAVERRRKPMLVEYCNQPLMEGGDASCIQWHLLARFVAHPQDDRMPAEVERQGERPAAI